MKKYQWTEGVRFKANAQEVGQELERLEAKHGGMLTPTVVVKTAKAASSPLHSCFEWDDTAAAQKYREEQARLVIRSVRIVRMENDVEAESSIAFVHVQTEQTGAGYTSTARALADDEMREQVLEDALIQLKGLRRRYAQLSALQKVFAAIDEVEVQLAKPPKRANAKRGRAQAARA